MLEKVLFFDAHFHFLQSVIQNADFLDEKYCGCSSCHSLEDLLQTPDSLYKSYGIHPLNPDKLFVEDFEKVLGEYKIHAIGECGFDFFTKESKADFESQKYVFELQLETALQKNLPLVIHCRKANDILFTYSKEMKKLPAVLFHSFMGNLVEAESFLNRGINGYYSFGKQIFNNNKKVIELVTKLPLEHLLLETDAPFQFLKGEKNTDMKEIKSVYEGAFCLRYEDKDENLFGKFSEQISSNFIKFYGSL